MAKPFRRRAISSVSRAYSSDPLERVASISGVNSDHSRWSLSQAAAISLIEQGSDEFFFRLPDTIVRVVVLTRAGEKYLQTERESTHPDDMLNLAAPGPAIAAQAKPQPRPLRLLEVASRRGRS